MPDNGVMRHLNPPQREAVLHVEGLQVVAHRTVEKNGYTAVQLGAFAQKAQRLTKPQAGHFRKAGVEAKKILAEFRIEGGELPAVGTEIKADHFQPGQMVDISGLSKGRGMQGAMYRWNFGGGTLQERNNATPFDTNTGYANRLYGIW